MAPTPVVQTDEDPPHDAGLLTYTADPNPLSGDACVTDQASAWVLADPGCSGRTCIDGARRFWVDGAPFMPRGVYNGGYEYAQLLDNCPDGQACQATTPADAAEYVAMLVDGGINVIMDRSLTMPAALRDAIHAEPKMKIAHLLWSDPFTEQGHDALVSEIEAAAADDDVVMWFGPDEIDLWNNWSESAGIRRLLRGNSAELDALLTGKYAPGGDPFLPEREPAHDPHNLPFGAALAYDPGLSNGTDVYDMLLPVTYPFSEPYSIANEGVWGTWRTSYFADQGVPVVPILQMIGIPEMDLSQPTTGQIEGQMMSALAHGARASFYYNIIGDKPKYAGRDGWFAPDYQETWDTYRQLHALQERLMPVLFSDTEETSGTHLHVEWRRWKLGQRHLLVVANPTPYARMLDLDAIVALQDGQFVRSYLDCSPFTERELELAAYRSLVVEIY